MSKDKKSRRASLDPADVLAGRVRPNVRDLIALIREVNPTGLGLEPRETARRYALKSRLQSALIRGFQDEVEVHPEPKESGVVALHHRPTGLAACHALVVELDDDARSFVQHLLDTAPREGTPGAHAEPRTAARTLAERDLREPPRGAGDTEARDVADLLRQGHEAAEVYDYELARERFEAALAQSGGAVEGASALLALLVDHLGADEDALAVGERLSAEALRDPGVRGLLAIASARRGAREQALALVAGRRGEAPAARVAEVYIALAKGALSDGRLAEASQDIARVRELDPTCAELPSLSTALAKARAAAREPAEHALVSLFAAGDLERAEAQAEELLARWPESEAARRISRALAEQRRREETERMLDEARGALAAGDMVLGRALLQKALATGLEGAPRAWAEERIATLEQEERARKEQARIEEIRHALVAGALPDALPAYAALPAASRKALRETYPAPALRWLDELAPPGVDAKGAIGAVLALRRAVEMAAREPEAALELLRVHAKVLQGFPPAEEVRRGASSTLAAQRRSAALGRLEAAARALSEGDPGRAERILGEVAREDLPEDEQTRMDALQANLRALLGQRALLASMEQARRGGDSLRALELLEELRAGTEGEEAARIEAIRAELRAEVRRRFCVEVEVFADGAQVEGPLHDAGIAPKIVWETLIEREPAGGPGGLSWLLAQSKGDRVFLRLVDVPSAQLRARVMLRSPAPLELIAATVRAERLVLVGRCGALLEVSIHDWTVVRWCPNVLRDDGVNKPLGDGGQEDLGLRLVNVDDVVISTSGRTLWVRTLGGSRERRRIHVLDLDTLRPIRELHDPRRGQLFLRSITGLSTPCVTILREDLAGGSGHLAFHEPRGLPSSMAPAELPFEKGGITACPGGERIFAAASDPSSPNDPFVARWGWTEIGARGVSPFRLFEGVTGVYRVAAATSFDAGMVFVLFELGSGGCELFGLCAEGDHLEIAYRVLLPVRCMLLASPDARRGALVCARGQGYTITELGPVPPAIPGDIRAVAFRLPTLPTPSIHAPMLECRKPVGARLAAVMEQKRVLERMSQGALARHLHAAQQKAGPDELWKLEQALLLLDRREVSAGEIGACAFERFPEHPRIRLSEARILGNMGRWQEMLDLLASVDPMRLDEAEAGHLHHLRGTALMMLDEPEAALGVLQLATTCKQRRCDLDALIAICTPLSDTAAAFLPELSVLRDYMAIIASADSMLARGDAAGARRALDCPRVWEANEVQGFARLAEAYLREEAAGGAPDRFRMTLALLSFCDLFKERNTFMRREMPLPRATWGTEKLADLATQVRARLA